MINGVEIKKLNPIPDERGRVMEVLRNDDRAQQVFEYMKKITGEAGLNARFAWDGDEVGVS